MLLNINDDQALHDPPEADVLACLADLEREQFAVLSRSDEDYVQAQRNEDDTFLLEYRAGSHDKHFSANGSIGVGDVVKAFRTFRAGHQDWHASWEWELVEFEEDFEGDLTCDNAYLLNGQEYTKIPVGGERKAVGRQNRRCPVCEACQDAFHLSGCELEECPRCHGLLMECDCE